MVVMSVARKVRCFLCARLHSRESTHFVGWTVLGWIHPRKVRMYQCDPCFKDAKVVADFHRSKEGNNEWKRI